MSTPVNRLNRAVEAFVKGGPFMILWSEVMESIDSIDPERDLAPDSHSSYELLCDLVDMGQPGTPTEVEARVGLIGEAELRSQLRGLRLVPTRSPA